jgi:AraC family transcriptional regulator, regulatory protein of adaptative response / methylated-DNA-[protein]-cysteine methyltransferase
LCNSTIITSTHRTYEKTAAQRLRSAWKNAEIIRDEQVTQSLCYRIFNSETLSEQKSLTVLVKGTNFQIQVWRALLQLPFGTIATYQTIAEMVAHPTAARAVGNAIGKNPIGYLIPCHRVIRESGEIGGFGWGVERKTVMLGMVQPFGSKNVSATVACLSVTIPEIIPNPG